MKTTWKKFLAILLAAAGILSLFAGCGKTGSSGTPSASSPNDVKISFQYTEMPGRGSNQVAAWVEDESGNVVRTLYVSDFTGSRRGYQREGGISLNHWSTAAKPDNMSDSQLDAISSASYKTGPQTITWDLKDQNGKKLTSGNYKICLEGTLFYKSSVVYTADIDLGSTGAGDLKVNSARTEPDNNNNETMIQNVKVTVE